MDVSSLRSTELVPRPRSRTPTGWAAAPTWSVVAVGGGVAVALGVAIALRRRWRRPTVDAMLLDHVVTRQPSAIEHDVRLGECANVDAALHLGSCAYDASSGRVIATLLSAGADVEKVLSFCMWRLLVRGNVNTFRQLSRASTPPHRFVWAAREAMSNDVIDFAWLDEGVSAFVSAGATFSVVDATGTTAAILACQSTSKPSERLCESVLSAMLQAPALDFSVAHRGDGSTALHVLCSRLPQSKDQGTLLRCLKMVAGHPSCRVDAGDHRGRTPLQILVERACATSATAPGARTEDAVRYLVQLGASPKATDHKGRSAFLVAASRAAESLLAAMSTDFDVV